MSDSRAVTLVVVLQSELADEVEELQENDPEYLEKLLRYGVVRRAVYNRLQGALPPSPRFPTAPAVLGPG